MEEGGRHYVGQKTEETTKRKSVGSLRGTSPYIRVGTLALTERQEIQIAEDNWVRRVYKETQKDRRKMMELRGGRHEKTPKDESSRKQNEMGRT